MPLKKIQFDLRRVVLGNTSPHEERAALCAMPVALDRPIGNSAFWEYSHPSRTSGQHAYTYLNGSENGSSERKKMMLHRGCSTCWAIICVLIVVFGAAAVGASVVTQATGADVSSPRMSAKLSPNAKRSKLSPTNASRSLPKGTPSPRPPFAKRSKSSLAPMPPMPQIPPVQPPSTPPEWVFPSPSPESPPPSPPSPSPPPPPPPPSPLPPERSPLPSS